MFLLPNRKTHFLHYFSLVTSDAFFFYYFSSAVANLKIALMIL